MGVIAHNLFVLFKHSVSGGDWEKYKVATVRWRLFHLPSKVVRHAGVLVFKVLTNFLNGSAIFANKASSSHKSSRYNLPQHRLNAGRWAGSV